MTVRVLIADDQELVRTGFRVIVNAEPNLDVVGQSRDGEQTIEAARQLRPDVVLMDIRMPNSTASRPPAGSPLRPTPRACSS